MQDQSREAILKTIKDLNKDDSKSIQKSKGALTAAGAAAVPILLETVTGAEPEKIRRRAAEVLGRIGSPAVEGLIGLTQHSDPLVRTLAVDALGTTRDQRALPAIQTALGDSSDKVRNIARAALKEFGLQVTPAAAAPPPPPPPVGSETTVEGVLAPAAVTLAPGRPLDGFRIMWWYFFAPGKYEEFRETRGKKAVRELAALPVASLVWVPLGIPVLAYLLMSSAGILTKSLLLLAVPLGWLMTWLLGRSTELGQRAGNGRSLAYLALVVVAGFVVFREMLFMAAIMGQLSGGTGLAIVATFLLALAAAIGIGWDTGVVLPALIPAIAGGIIGFLVPSYLNIEYVPIYFWGLCVVVGAVIAILPALAVSRFLKRFHGTGGRLVVLGVATILSLGLIWLTLIVFGAYLLSGSSG